MCQYFKTILSPQPSELQNTTLAIIIDGFDTCEPVYSILMDMIAAVTQGSPSTIRIFLTSEKQIPELSHFPSIGLLEQPEISNNIRQMVNQGISFMIKQGRLAKELQEGIARTLVSQVEGKEVLMVKLLLQEMEYSRVPSTSALIYQQINTLPGCINELFFFQLERVHEPCREWSAKVLHWLLLAVRPMTLEELRIALALSIKTEPSSASIVIQEHLSLSLKDDIYFILGGLVQVTGPYVTLIHNALGRYLIAKDEPLTPGEEPNILGNSGLIISQASDSSGMEIITRMSCHRIKRLNIDFSIDVGLIDSDSESIGSEEEAPNHQREESTLTFPAVIPNPSNVRDWCKIKDIHDAHKEIAQLCISFLAIDAKGNLDQTAESPYGWDYALATWTEHFHKGIPQAEVSFKVCNY